MANIKVSYDSLANVQRSLEEDIGNDQLTQIKADLTTAKSTISNISSGHDNVWSNALKTISTQLTSLNDSIESVLELATRTGSISDNFYESENKIKDNVNGMDSELAEYFGLPENSGYTVTANTGAQTTKGAETTSPAANYDSTSRTATMTSAVTGSILKSITSEEEDKKIIKEDDKDKKQSPQKIEDESEKNKEINKSDDKINENDSKNDSTYKEAKENAESTASSTIAKNVTASVAGTTAMGTAAGVASSIGNPNNTTTTTSNESTKNEEIKTENEEVTGEALGEFTEDPIEGTIEVESESGTHQTAPIDVNIDKANGTQVIPALAGVAAAGASGIGTKIVLDKRNSDDEENDEEEKETFSGDYETAGTNENEQLDITDDIGFDPTEIIEKDELGENNFSENIEEDSESSDDEGFNAMPALAGALAGGLAGAGAGMLLDDEDDDEEEK
jgi:hypothetical protein